ncbi:MAG TPA: response regulator transcription factor [Bacteroidia bacterium]|nr:response regulator transcription factor [Bacteroidia bacterium]
MTEKVKIIIADDHNLVRQSISVALETQKGFKVVGQAENGKVLLDLVKKHRPDVVVLDLEMPVMNGWEALDQLKEHFPSCKVVILSMHFEGLLIKDLVVRGARGFLPKSSDFETLINAIYEVNDLGYFFSKKISNRIVQELLMSNTIDPSFRQFKLNEGEVDTLLMICEDKTNKEIALKLLVSERTVERHKTSLFKKTNAKTAAGLVLFALKNNLISRNPGLAPD